VKKWYGSEDNIVDKLGISGGKVWEEVTNVTNVTKASKVFKTKYHSPHPYPLPKREGVVFKLTFVTFVTFVSFVTLTLDLLFDF
jgi:hypothetical protein